MDGRVRQAAAVGGLLLGMAGLLLALTRTSDILLLAFLAVLFASILDHLPGPRVRKPCCLGSQIAAGRL